MVQLIAALPFYPDSRRPAGSQANHDAVGVPGFFRQGHALPAPRPGDERVTVAGNAPPAV